MDALVRALAARQVDVVAHWQLIDLGLTERMIRHRIRRGAWRVVHRGVYALSQAPLRQEQLWMAATLTTRDSYLSHQSAGARYGIYRWPAPFEVVTRAGAGGRRRFGRLMVWRSRCLDGDIGVWRGMRMTSPERTVVDLAALAGERGAKRLLREALRLELTTPARLAAAADRHRTRRNSSVIAQTVAHYAADPKFATAART
jgi:Transcriptional regulator, AbiEi antitoxin